MHGKALQALALFCFGSFGWGMVWHFRRSGAPSRSMLVTGVPAAAFACLQIFALSHRRILLPGAAALSYGAGAVLFWWSVWVSRRKLAACGQGVVSTEVIASGPYRFIRHPFYTSYLLTWAFTDVGGRIRCGPVVAACGCRCCDGCSVRSRGPRGRTRIRRKRACRGLPDVQAQDRQILAEPALASAPPAFQYRIAPI